MSTIRVANIDFDSTSNNQLVYVGSNTVTLRAAGSNVMTINSSSINFLLPVSGSSIISNVTQTITTLTTNTLTVNSFVINGQVNINGMITPTAINVNTSAFSPPVANNTIVRFSANSSNNSALSIYGMTAGTNGQIIILSNIGTKAVTLTAEDGINESTAANRFNLPQNITLNGYQSISLYYDGNVSRWKPTDISNIKIIYKSILCKGFFSAGLGSPAIVATADRTTYSTETTAAVPGANLSQARRGLAAAGNVCKGFFIGGRTNPTTAFVTTANRTTYSTETAAAVPGANLSLARRNLAAAGNACKGFFIGGANTAGRTTADRTTYSTEATAAVPGANLSQARYCHAAVGNACKGFFAGGVTTTVAVATAERTNYSAETTAAVSGANLSQGRCQLAAAGNACKGFFSGGSMPTAPGFVVATADRTTYSTETTAAVPGANLNQARLYLAAAGNGCKGFFSGGCATAFVTTAERTTYSTETTAAVPGANLSQGRIDLAAV